MFDRRAIIFGVDPRWRIMLVVSNVLLLGTAVLQFFIYESPGFRVFWSFLAAFSGTMLVFNLWKLPRDRREKGAS